MNEWHRHAGEVAGWLQSDLGKTLLGGAAGGLVRWITLRESIAEGVASLIVGALCAVYLGPLAEPVIEPVVGVIDAGPDADAFAAFVIGLGGIGLAGGLIDLTRRFRRKDARDGDGGPASGGAPDAE